MPLPLRKANETLKGDNSLAGNSGGKRQKPIAIGLLCKVNVKDLSGHKITQ
jgi:hypothetical protein